ncbi:protein FAM83G [Synchiropus splendidus]|uniref:protein FAM83G n=1 Tax=Synchiropus splendidus TaxID=270530 RepID=UPI00237E6E40|nr:protein FAM83G [Synchiropus splendidus]
MALSQIQCLDEHHVNWRVSESKPEFFYSEEQRLALEALITEGQDAFADYIQENKVRGFLSEPELERIAENAELYRPGHEFHQRPETPGPGNLTPGSGEEAAGDGEVSLQYWPDRSEGSVAELDIGWPEAISYRGVTRVTVYTQPPTEGHAHIKEVVRKSIASAQKVIAVVMDAFTDVDIFRDLLDAAYRRRVPVYIILDTAAVPCFLSMCGRADMHRGHLKNLRVRCCGGVEFLTRSAQKVRGSLSEKFLLVDGDRAISGSYSFTWSSSRLDRNLITVITGQAVETFDLQFRELFLLSRGVSLSKVPMQEEPVREPVPQAAPAPLPAAIARKLVNPKYALVATGTPGSPAPSDQNSSNKNSQVAPGPKLKKGRLREALEEPPLHPGLAHLEKAYLIPYLPTWPEPDPPSDVIGFINIMDEKRSNKVHLQRSERFEVSQAIRFSSPLKDSQAPAAEPGSPAPPRPAPAHHDATDAPASSSQTPAPPPEPTETAAPPTTDQAGAEAAAPPVPKRRTLHLVIDQNPIQQPVVTLVKVNPEEASGEEITLTRGRLTSTVDGEDSGSNGEGSQDSTKVICDKAADQHPSSASTVSEEEFYDCSQHQPGDPLTNGVTVGSGQGARHGDGFNMMARMSQSMLDLREPSQSDDSAALLRQSRQLRHRGHPSPHRHIGQLFRLSRSPARDSPGPKVVLAKPGSFHRPSRASGPVIGGHRYWQSQTLQPDSPGVPSARSPRRHSPGYRKGDPAQPALAGPLGVPFSKLSNFRHLRGRGGASQKKVSQSNKAVR